MLTSEENALACRVEGDAPAGILMRRYWHPVLIADEVAEPDGAPVRVRLVGNDFVLFRASDGQLGMLDAACPHRLASLALGRNEEGGLRCIYHGWKFDVHGSCMEMPTEPAGYGFQQRLSVRSYPLRDAGGLVWAYVGPPEHEPPFPAFDWTQLPRAELGLFRYLQDSNYLQATEGAIDTAHSQFLHRGILPDGSLRVSVSRDLSPRLEAEDTNYGFRYAAIRRTLENPETTKYVRVTHFVFPTIVLVPRPLDPSVWSTIQIFVPMDDTHTMHFSIVFKENGDPVDEPAFHAFANWYPGVNVDANFRFGGTAANGWLQDRAAMKDGRMFTGIPGFAGQDAACQESMGAIVDRRGEHLGTSDIAIIRMRRRMIENIKRTLDGAAPIGTDGRVDYAHMRSEQRIIGIDEPWQHVGALAGEFGVRVTER